jgi:FlaA1/EpsC-like NDP-sugar epimerase
VTGAGGTIGSELVRQAAALRPERLILLDSAEPNLYEIDMVLQTMADAPSWRSVLGDIKDRKGLDVLMEEERPEVVLHAAALKHVPLMEGNVSETVRTNLMGTRNVVEAAAAADVEAVVSISTDKAVDPSSIMGASKRAVELYLAAAADKVEPMKLASVRFGNVLGSAGSVVPLFERQIAEGGPVTVTDSDTTRYFMTVEEAAGLVLEAGAQAGAVGLSGGDIFLLDMGEPVLISRLARQLIRLRGLEPERDVKIVFTGLRPGEKLHESLTHAFENVSPAGPPGVMRIETPDLDLTRVESALEQLIAAAQRRDDDQVRNRLNLVIEAGWPEGVTAISQTLPAARDA